jgi:hypothetical protein
MTFANPIQLRSIVEVVEYWQNCLDDLEHGVEETLVASHMVGVVSNTLDDSWSEQYLAYAAIFERATALELPIQMYPDKFWRRTTWDEIRRLLLALRARTS